MATIASATPLRRNDGSVRGTVIIVHDVTEFVEAVEVREQFLRTASHELRTPLTSVTGFLSLIDDALDPHDTKVRQYIEVVMRRADDLLRRISDLVVATDDDRPLSLVDFDLREAVDAAALYVRALADVRGNQIEVSSVGPLPVRADRARIETAVTEVLTNAVKFGESGTRITLACGSDGEHTWVTVSNEGAGLTPAEQRRVFDRFYRTSHARAHAIQGYGLGLTTVRSIVSAHQGRISIDSAPGAGLTFTFDIPVNGPVLDCPAAQITTPHQ
ncbi:sensor histidine kinase [Microbacterium trichothecenolyticum]|uniref:histidine kinase n=1 Tax=Microbacterium trichothecenolyticum TaxID=69370 RepID=A0ABU0TVF2_MICTR|nr:HAMP domain-containing sensor histidine kinase [Microbacterium trichothecenolyticum]MDQ1123640.1 signal transduction histidine kinase [Microbacterium trichothecenolyticum]